MKPITIAMVCDFFHPNVGGVENHIYMLGANLIRRGHRVVVITHSHPPDRVGIRWLLPSVKVYYLPFVSIASSATLPNFFTFLPYLRTIILRERVQLIHAHASLSSLAHEGILHAHLMGVRTVFTDHSLFGFDDAASILTNKLLEAALRNVDAAICVSHTGRENTVLRASLLPEDVHVIPNAIVANQFKPAPIVKACDTVTIVVISRLAYRKGIDLLVATAPRICALFPHVRFLIGGDGPKMIDLLQMREKHMLQDRIEMLGPVRHSDVRDVLVQGSIFMNTSLTESFGIAILEAACTGLYVVSTRVGGVPEILPEDMISFANPDEDDVVRAMSEAIEIVSAGKHDPIQAHQRIKGFYDWSEIAERTERVYELVMESPQRDFWCRMQRTLELGRFAGLIFAIILVVDCLFFVFLQWWLPEEDMDHVRMHWDQSRFVEFVQEQDIDRKQAPSASISSRLRSTVCCVELPRLRRRVHKRFKFPLGHTSAEGDALPHALGCRDQWVGSWESSKHDDALIASAAIRIDPILPADRNDNKLYQFFFVWFSSNMNILSFGTGSAGPAFFGLGLREALITLLVVDVISCAVPAYFAVFGPKLGLRSMVHARYSWGYYGAILPSALTVFSMQGFLILNCIIGGQALASVSDHLNDTLGIVIVGVISLMVTFFGYRVIHWYETIAWIPNVITFIVMLGIGGKHLGNIPSPPAPASAAMILSFATTTASTMISWCIMTPDYGVYHTERASRTRIFSYSYAGFLTASIPSHMLGAAFAAAAPFVPSWKIGFDNGNSVGGLLEAVLSSSGGFGKFLTVLVALSVPSACAPTMYTFGSSFMTIHPLFARIPRYVYTIVSEAILIPVAIVGATHFYNTFVDILNVIGYWSAVFAAIVLVEHFIFRKDDFLRYDLKDWNQAGQLPPGIAAMFAFLCACGIIIPCMSQAWYTGPIAHEGTGDIGILGDGKNSIC
ncbi:Phosphatidylinositol N-acetylglucosaminyltransferase gpi3 subunit [Grifola frondosa]|uniref:Phosphatidylinositol N-acetylglucosaminyltransferase gpi3 subunit n=1 Tax=Grifola frondosa TaxID=5627 RepID=A0A1C7MLJ7_GRIFR|nr:Phosphatidylinositol N-acetylglucosaminyltransferase gpi3 subunit [Grifola frondosa]